MPECIIDGCHNEGKHNIGVRCRRPDTTAIWSPNSEAYLCDQHAEDGCIIDITITPTTDQEVEVNVKNGTRTRYRKTPIRHDADE